MADSNGNKTINEVLNDAINSENEIEVSTSTSNEGYESYKTNAEILNLVKDGNKIRIKII